MEFILLISGLLFCISFVIFIFLKSYIDNKKEKKLMTEIFMKYGEKTNAKISYFIENHTYGRYIPGKYNYYISFEYNSTKCGALTCSYVLPTNNPKSKEYLKCDEIPIIYIPAHLDYYNGLISRKEFFNYIGHKLRLGNDQWLVIFAEDISFFTNLDDF